MRKMSIAVGLVFILSIPLLSFAEDKGVQWLDIQEAEALQVSNPKPLFVYVYTDWCSWCVRMERETYSHPVIIDYLNTHFHPVKFNAESGEDIVFRGETYSNPNPGGRRSAHSLAAAMLQGRMGYPTVVLFDEEINLLTPLPGFRNAQQMEAVLVYFSEQVYLEDKDLESFTREFRGLID